MMTDQTSFHGTYLNLRVYLFNDFKNGNFSFMTKVNPNSGNETKPDIFSSDVLKSDIIFIGCKILKYFNDFYNWNFSISL